ncbi:metallophosphoesterase family protein [Paenibacillus medicaginis]|uniref:Metallophosphoesterase family protein n=1 Tax=Paenibacillus medicaginis TaxID=1470560 RepID=A0ABV5BUD5_9BACL
MRTLAISDIHGCFDEFNALLKHVKYNPAEDKLIILGDLVDRGQRSKQVVEQLMNMVSEWNVVVLRGNHDQMMIDALNADEDVNWLNNGGYQTVESYVGLDFFEEIFEWDLYEQAKNFIRRHFKHHIDFLSSLPYYYETDTHIFVHAGINPYKEHWKQTSDEDFVWIRERFYNVATGLNKIVVFGHTPTVHLHETEDIWFSPNGDKIGIDGACAYGMQLNCLEINDAGYKTHYATKGSR